VRSRAIYRAAGLGHIPPERVGPHRPAPSAMNRAATPTHMSEYFLNAPIVP
jgi:hypothetical protein